MTLFWEFEFDMRVYLIVFGKNSLQRSRRRKRWTQTQTQTIFYFPNHMDTREYMNMYHWRHFDLVNP